MAEDMRMAKFELLINDVANYSCKSEVVKSAKDYLCLIFDDTGLNEYGKVIFDKAVLYKSAIVL